MIRTPLSTTSVIDEAAEVVAVTASPWAALLMATAIPYRFLQALFIDRLAEVGENATSYGNLLGATGNAIVLTLLLSLTGRAIYARACRLASARGTAPGRETWRIKPAAVASYILTASVLMLGGYFAIFTIFGYIAVVAATGIAVGTIELNDRVSLTRPFTHILRASRHFAIPVALVFVFFCAMLVALINLIAASSLAVWLASAIGGIEAPNWQVLFSFANRRFALLLLAGALIVVEPFWVAAHVIYVRKAGAEESGDDLRAWFDELRREEEPKQVPA